VYSTMGFSCLDVGGLLAGSSSEYVVGLSPCEVINDGGSDSDNDETGVILLEGTVVLTGLGVADVLEDSLFLHEIRKDIADAADVDVEDVEIVAVRTATVDDSRRRLNDENDDVAVDFEITASTGRAEIIANELETYDFPGVTLYASENGYGVISTTVKDVDEVSPPTPAPAPVVGDGSDGYSTTDLALTAVFCLMGGALLSFLVTRLVPPRAAGGFRQRLDSNMSGISLKDIRAREDSNVSATSIDEYMNGHTKNGHTVNEHSKNGHSKEGHVNSDQLESTLQDVDAIGHACV